MTAPAEQTDLTDRIRWDDHGLVTVVVQDVADGRVLMVGHADREALSKTIETGDVHFHSRSRGRLWRKGETSGNVLRLVDLALDCDGDAILASVEPAGPACHTGSRSCFDQVRGAPLPQGFAWLEELWTTIDARAYERPSGSYTAQLLEGGVDATVRKVTEEATEVLLAAKAAAAADDGPGGEGGVVARAALADESADLLFHLLVVLAERRLEPAAVIEALRRRHAARATGFRRA